jgi:hypothetical protein
MDSWVVSVTAIVADVQHDRESSGELIFVFQDCEDNETLMIERGHSVCLSDNLQNNDFALLRERRVIVHTDVKTHCIQQIMLALTGKVLYKHNQAEIRKI